ncbi:MAG: hypothetical protein O3B01_26650 [Planctomycetota bacterium]|nr:hypothetical protein [Planctomycetota bacterium]
MTGKRGNGLVNQHPGRGNTVMLPGILQDRQNTGAFDNGDVAASTILVVARLTRRYRDLFTVCGTTILPGLK